MNYNAIIFDFNGTLFFDTPLHIKAWDTISKQLNCGPITLDIIVKKYWGLKNIDLLKGLTDNAYSLEEYELLSSQKEALYRSYVKEDPSYQLAEGVPEFFDYLKSKGIPFTIASASIKENIDFYIEHFHLDQWIDPSTIVYDDGNYPNKEEMYRQAIKNLNCALPVLVFEDSSHGLKAAHNVKADVIAMDTPEVRDLHLDYIKAYIKDYQNIIKIID